MKFLFIIHDNKQKSNTFPLGPAYLAAVLREKGHDVSAYCMDVYHYTPEDLKEYLEKNKFDAVGIGFMAARLDFVQECAKAVNSVKNKPIFIIGGPGPTPIPEYCLRTLNADIAILGEGELILPDLLESIKEKIPLSKVRGIAYKEKNKVYVNERREPIKNLDSLPFPAWDLFPVEKYVDYNFPSGASTDRVMGVITSRGCAYRCSFCYRMEQGIRLRSIENVIEELKILNKKYRINAFNFLDELFMLSEKRVLDICDAIVKEGLKIKFTVSGGRLNIVNENILEALKKAGCVFVGYGVEAYDQKVLDLMNKHITIEQIDKGLELTAKYGLGVGVYIMFGNIGDNEETIQKGTDLVLKYSADQCRTIRPVTPYPGSDLYYYAIKQGLLKGPEDFFKKHKNSDAITVNFTNLSDKKIYELLSKTNKKLVQSFYNKKSENLINAFNKLYFYKDYSFRGAR